MSKTQIRPPDEVYREYQESRDNIPQASLATLRVAAEAQRAEANIESILEQAKPLHSKLTGSGTSNRNETTSILEKIGGWLLGNGWSVGGAAVAGALVALVGLPMFNQGGLSGTPYAQFDDCDECASYIANASALTRSTGLTLSRIDPKQRLAAKKGRLSAKFEIARVAELDGVAAKAFREYAKIAKVDAGLSEHAESSGIGTAINALAASSSEHAAVFSASKALFIANLTARNLVNSEANELRQSLITAINALNSVESKNELQRNITAQLSQLAKQETYTETEAEMVIEITRRAMESLG